jgi:hypothetical protein
MNHFNPETALSYARAISRPRMVGTAGEEITRQKISRRLEQIGLQVSCQPFRFSTAMGEFLALEILTSQLLILASIGVSRLEPRLVIFLVIPLVMLILAIRPLNRSVQMHSFPPKPGEPFSLWSKICWNLGARYATENIVGTYPGASGKPGLPGLYLVAHYDSKSQRIPLVIRIALFAIGIGGSLVFAGLIVLGIFIPVLTTISYGVAGVALLSSIPLLFLDAGNISPGAIDDASGVGVVLHLAEVLASQPEIHNRLNVTVLVTSAEELGTVGALAYVLENQSELRRQSVTGGLHVLNFDGPGVLGSLYLAAPVKKSHPSVRISLEDLVKEACEELGYRIGRFGLPGALFDHLPFADLGFDTASLIAIGKSTWFVHSAQDSADKLDQRGFEQAGMVGLLVMERLLAKYQAQPQRETVHLDKTDLYKNDPVLRFLVGRLHLTPNRMLFAAFTFGVLDLLIAWRYNLLYSREGIIGALRDPPYLLTMFIMIPLFLRTYVWMADGIWGIFMGLQQNRLIPEQDLETYHKNISRLAARYTTGWVVFAMVCTVILQVLINFGNLNYPHTYNTILTPRLVLFRIPLGVLAVYGAASVLVRLALLGDWRDLMEGIEPQINPLHWDQACGYSPFTNYIINLLGIYVGLATFLFSKLLFQPARDQVALQPVYDLGILVSLILVLVMGYVIFYYFPTGTARRAMLKAKRQQMETISDRYINELRLLSFLLGERSVITLAIPEPADSHSKVGKPTWEPPTVKGQIEHLKQLDDAMGLIEKLPESPISQKALGRFGISYVSIPLSTILYNSFQFLISGQKSLDTLQQLLAGGSIVNIVQGILCILFTGKLNP